MLRKTKNPEIVNVLEKMKELGDLVEYLERFPEDRDLVIKEMLLDNDLAFSLIASYRTFNFDSIGKFISLFPEYKNEMFDQIILKWPKNYNTYEDVFYNTDNLNALLQMHPESLHKVAKKLLSDNTVYEILQRFGTFDSLVKFLNVLPDPDFNDKIYNGLFEKTVPECVVDEKYYSTVDYYKYRDWDEFLKENSSRNMFGSNPIRNFSDFVSFLEYYPGKRKDIFEELLAEKGSICYLLYKAKSNKKTVETCAQLLKKLLEYFPEHRNEIVKKIILSQSALFNMCIRSTNDLKNVLKILPECREAIFNIFINHVAMENVYGFGHSLSFIDCFVKSPCLKEYRAAIDEILSIFPDKKFEIAQRLLADWQDLSIKSKSDMNSIVARFPEYRKIFKIIIEDLASAIKEKSADSVDSVLKKIQDEVHDSHDFILLSGALNRCDTDYRYYRVINTNENVQLSNKLKELHEYINKSFPSLFSFAVNCAKQHGLFANKQKCKLEIMVQKHDELDNIFERENAKIRRGDKIILVNIEHTNDWHIMGKLHTGEAIHEKIEDIYFIDYLKINAPDINKRKDILDNTIEYLGTNMPKNLLPHNQAAFEKIIDIIGNETINIGNISLTFEMNTDTEFSPYILQVIQEGKPRMSMLGSKAFCDEVIKASKVSIPCLIAKLNTKGITASKISTLLKTQFIESDQNRKRLSMKLSGSIISVDKSFLPRLKRI